VGLLAVARAVTALGRESFIPPIFSLVSAKLGTPIFTTAILGIVTGERLTLILTLTYLNPDPHWLDLDLPLTLTTRTLTVSLNLALTLSLSLRLPDLQPHRTSVRWFRTPTPRRPED